MSQSKQMNSQKTTQNNPEDIQGILLVNKPRGKTSFSLVGALRRLLKVKKIGHAGTLDPFATGVMVMLIGRQATRLSDQFLCADKEYLAQLKLGVTTDTFDCEGTVVGSSDIIPTQAELEAALSQFQGDIQQIPPMYSAKKQNGKKLYELARKGQSVTREPVKIKVNIQLISYSYPYVDIAVTCTKGTYIRSLGHDIGVVLGCGAHLSQLQRTRSGSFHLADCIDGALLNAPTPDLLPHLRSVIMVVNGATQMNTDIH